MQPNSQHIQLHTASKDALEPLILFQATLVYPEITPLFQLSWSYYVFILM